MLTTHRGIQVLDSRGTMLDSMVSGSNFGILNWDSPTRLPGNANPSSPDVSLSSASLITSTNWQTKTNLGSDNLQILISLQMDVTINQIQHRSSINLKRQTGTETVERLKTSWAKDDFRPTAKKEKRSCVPLFLKQPHTTYPLDDTDSTQSRFQQRYWKRWEHEMTSDPETLPRPPYLRWTMRSLE